VQTCALPILLCLCSTYCVFMFYVMCSTYCVFLCLLYAPIHQNKFQVGVNLLGNKYYSDSDSDSDLTAAFDTVDHTILLERLHTTIGLSDSALKWFQSYLSGRTEYVSLGRCKSRQLPVSCGVPQGSVLGPI